jgi:translation elongation factor P/translation initiation factor 5A
MLTHNTYIKSTQCYDDDIKNELKFVYPGYDVKVYFYEENVISVILNRHLSAYIH